MAKILCAEIGYSAIKFVEMDYRVKNPKVYQSFSIPVPEGVCTDGYFHEEMVPEVAQVVADCLKQRKIKTKKVIFSVFSGRIINREIVLPAVRDNAIDGVIHSNLTDYFPVDLSEYRVDYTVLDTIGDGKEQGRIKVLVMAAEERLIAQYTEFAQKCGLRLVNLCYTGDSIYTALKGRVSEQCEAVVKLEEQYIIISIINQGKLLLQRTINYGVSEMIDEVLHHASLESATYEEAWKLLTSTDLVSTNAEEGMEWKESLQGIAKSLAGGVARIIDFHNSHSQDNHVKGIVLAGVGAKVPGLEQVFTEQTECSCVQLKNLPMVHGAVKEKSLCSYASCVGAGILKNGFVANEAKEKEEKKNNYISAIVLISIFFAIAIFAMWQFSYAPYKKVVEKKRDLEFAILENTPAETLYYKYQGVKGLFTELDAADRLAKRNNDGLLDFLAELEKKMPSDMMLDSFQSDETKAVMGMCVKTKEEAAGVIKTLREFESLMNVTVGSVTEENAEAESENDVPTGTWVKFSVECQYYPLYSEKAQ